MLTLFMNVILISRGAPDRCSGGLQLSGWCPGWFFRIAWPPQVRDDDGKAQQGLLIVLSQPMSGELWGPATSPDSPCIFWCGLRNAGKKQPQPRMESSFWTFLNWSHSLGIWLSRYAKCYPWRSLYGEIVIGGIQRHCPTDIPSCWSLKNPRGEWKRSW